MQLPGFVVFAAYPLIPWIGVTAVGYGLGQLYRWAPERRRALLFRLGVALLVVFVALRLVNSYGDPSPWTAQRTVRLTALSFLNATKYPPSLLFLLMTLGPAFLFLRAVDGATPRALQPARLLGKVPLFYFLCHFPLIHLLAIAVGCARFGAVHWFFESPSLDRYPFTPPPEWGFPLPMVYGAWVLVVFAMYPLCRWFAAVKERSAAPWLSYL